MAEDKQSSWWQTVPGILTAVGSLLAAVTGLIIALNQAGLLHGPSPMPSASPSAVVLPENARTVTLPSLIGVPLNAARLVLRSLGFADISTGLEFSDAAPGTVIEQDPAPGTNLPVNRMVKLEVAQRRTFPAPKGSGPAAKFAGVWREILPLAASDHGHPMWLKLDQDGQDVVSVEISYTGSFSGGKFGSAVVKGNKAAWTVFQGCAAPFQHPGYNYDHPGSDTFTMTIDGSTLTYEAVTLWSSPCDGHPTGAETETKKLQRVTG
jgi:hypothetical protein